MQSSSSIPPPDRPRRLCLFGGSFDPVHLGHTSLAAAAITRCQLEKIIFVPAWRSPHKQDRDPPAPASDRLAMLQLAVADAPWAEVSRWEIERAAPSYSWQTAEHFAATAGPGIELCWLLGADQWACLHTWARPDILAARLTFLVFPRGPEPVVPRPGFRHEAIDFRHPASSTAVRAAVRAGRSLDGMVAPAVAAYIRSRHLYREGGGGIVPGAGDDGPR
jgi:nicotinate-nucleotide adenylyltransferase